jgi:hypothetical protein
MINLILHRSSIWKTWLPWDTIYLSILNMSLCFQLCCHWVKDLRANTHTNQLLDWSLAKQTLLTSIDLQRGNMDCIFTRLSQCRALVVTISVSITTRDCSTGDGSFRIVKKNPRHRVAIRSHWWIRIVNVEKAHFLQFGTIWVNIYTEIRI